MSDTSPPIPYYGAKATMAPRIAALFPEHRHYVEPFAGSLAVLLAKPASPRETVNDADGELVTFWRVLRDRYDDLARVCLATPHSRAQFAHDMQPVGILCAPAFQGQHSFTVSRGTPAPLPVKPVIMPCDNRKCVRWRELETARRVWSRLNQGRAHLMANTGWRFDVSTTQSATSGPKSITRDMDRFWGRLAPAAARIRRVQIENDDAITLINRYGAEPEVLIYADPPYLGKTRNGTGYRHEMSTEAEHLRFLESVVACRSTVVISGYRSTLYDDALSGWYVEELPTSTSQGGQGKATCEILWSNRPMGARVQGSIFDTITNPGTGHIRVDNKKHRSSCESAWDRCGCFTEQ
jgi:DNA adenine methylase